VGGLRLENALPEGQEGLVDEMGLEQ
jgi:hypothetical protein